MLNVKSFTFVIHLFWVSASPASNYNERSLQNNYQWHRMVFISKRLKSLQLLAERWVRGCNQGSHRSKWGKQINHKSFWTKNWQDSGKEMKNIQISSNKCWIHHRWDRKISLLKLLFTIYLDDTCVGQGLLSVVSFSNPLSETWWMWRENNNEVQ